MAVRARLGSHSETVQAGGSAAFDLALFNDGDAPVTVKLSVTGPGRPYSWVAPDTATIEPGQQAAARVGFHMPAGPEPPAGSFPFQVVMAGAAAQPVCPPVDAVLELAPFSALSVTLDPPEAAGKGPSRHRLSVANRGNAPTSVTLRAEETDGLDVTLDPSTVVASPNQPSTVAVEVTPRAKLFSGDDRPHAFTVLATPDVGAPAKVAGRFVQQAAVAGRTLVTSGVVAGVVILALILGLTVFSDDSSTSSAGTDVTGPPPSGAADCPTEGHVDNFGVNGLRPEDIPRLPNTYSFFATSGADRCKPVRFNPCEPVHYVQNAALAPPTGAADVREAFDQLSRATGITFVDDGLTDETSRRVPYVPERYGERWAPILVSWLSFGEQSRDPAIQVVGGGVGQRRGDVFVSGTLGLNVDAVTDKDAQTPVEGGFGPPLGSGTGAVGAKGVTWGRVILHELAHVVGLGHTRDRGAIMYPETAEQTSRPAAYREPDLAGLRHLGREAGCLQTPPPGA